MPEWHEHRTNVADLVKYLMDEGWDSDEVSEAVRRPWKYADEYVEMRKVDPA